MNDFMSYIRALHPITSRVRTDITALKKDGKMMWTKQNLTDARLVAHFENKGSRGVCPIKAGERVTKVALLDLDSHRGETAQSTMFKVASDIAERLFIDGVYATPFRSSGGKGIHLFMLWNDSQDAYSVRKYLSGVLVDCGFKNGTGGVANGEIEIFPKQDYVPEDGCGSQFILPLSGLSVPLNLVKGTDLPYEAVLDEGFWQISHSVPAVEKSAPVPSKPPSGVLEEWMPYLYAIDPNDLNYEEWLEKVGFALHYETEGSDEGFDLWDAWSSQSAKYTTREYGRYKWDSIKNDKDRNVTGQTLINMARERGYVADILDDFDILDEGEPSKPKRFKMIQAHDFTARMSLKWSIKKVLPRSGIAMIFGKSGSGKSFFALDMIACIARGIDWCGHKVEQGSVVYVATEGVNGFRNRLYAYARHHNIELAKFPLYIIPDTPNLRQNDDEHLIQSILEGGGASVVVIDTLAQASAGANENSGEDMGPILTRCKRINDKTGAVVILVHHSGKDEARGARGWSGIRAAMDTEIEITLRGTDGLAIVTKQKDGETGGSFVFKLEQVSLGFDEDGEEITSCVIDVLPNFTPEERKTKGKWQKNVFEAVLQLSCLGSIPSTKEVIDSAIEAEVYDPGTTEKPKRDSRRDSAKRALNELIKVKIVFKENDRIILPQSRICQQNNSCEVTVSADLSPQIPQHPVGVRNCGADEGECAVVPFVKSMGTLV